MSELELLNYEGLHILLDIEKNYKIELLMNNSFFIQMHGRLNPIQSMAHNSAGTVPHMQTSFLKLTMI